MKRLRTDDKRVVFSVLASFAAGALLHTAHPAAVAVTAACPAIWTIQRRRIHTYGTAAAYYAAALWPAVACIRALQYDALTAVSSWIAGTLLLALPWPATWTPNRSQLLLRVAAAGFISIVPPLGIVGLAVPASAAGYLFPNLHLFGVATTLVMPAVLCWRRGIGTAIVGVCILVANSVALVRPVARVNWQAVEVVSARTGDAFSDYANLQRAFTVAEASYARVIVFPEAFLRSWTPVSSAFFEQSIQRLAARRKTLLIGAVAPMEDAHSLTAFTAQLDRLRGSSGPEVPRAQFGAKTRYRNVVIAMGADSGTYDQRVPVPFGMWQPLRARGARLNLTGAPILAIAGERAAILICYEQLIAWPALASVMHDPTVLVGVANDVWVDATCVPELQRAYLRAWARLLGIGYVASSAHLSEPRQ